MVHLHTELKSHSGKFRREKYAPPAAAADEKKRGGYVYIQKKEVPIYHYGSLLMVQTILFLFIVSQNRALLNTCNFIPC